MLPLGDLWMGVCTAVADEPWQPDANALHTCNLGYARGECGRFPSAEGPDAVRFAIRSDDGECVTIAWVTERDHHPFAHGSMAFSTRDRCVREPSPRVVAAQAQAYAESYLRRKWEAGDGR